MENREEYIAEEYAAPRGEYRAAPAKKSFLNKLKALPKKVWIGIGAGVVALIALIIIIGALNNTPTTPIKLQIAAMNNKKASKHIDKSLDTLNGFLEDEVRDMYNLMKKSDYAEDMMEYMEESAERQIEHYQDRYGDNYKFSFEVEDKEKMDKDDLKLMRDKLRNAGKSMKEDLEEVEDYDSDDWADAAEDAGLSKSQMKNLYKIMEKIAKTLSKADVSEGYEITVTIKITGSELDEPEEIEQTYNVYKINGRWVNENVLSVIRSYM